jgi:hypothetical protein
VNKRTLQLAPIVVLICACSLWSTCPGQTNKGWPQNSTVYYSTGNISGTELSQLQSAISDWVLRQTILVSPSCLRMLRIPLHLLSLMERRTWVWAPHRP